MSSVEFHWDNQFHRDIPTILCAKCGKRLDGIRVLTVEEASQQLQEQNEKHDEFVMDVLRHFGCEVIDEPLDEILNREDDFELVTKALAILEGSKSDE